MYRIFFTLSLVAITALSAALIVGLASERLVERRDLLRREKELSTVREPTQLQQAELVNVRRQLAELDWLRRWGAIHFLLGVSATLVVILVNSISVTYFIGTGRWCREVVEAYEFDSRYITATQHLKRRSFPWAVTGMLTVLGISMLGAAADTVAPEVAPRWLTFHLIGAILGLAIIAWSFFAQWINIVENHKVIEEVTAEVTRARHQRGLPA